MRPGCRSTTSPNDWGGARVLFGTVYDVKDSWASNLVRNRKGAWIAGAAERIGAETEPEKGVQAG
jgi:hypothetical protein